jgi:hypothetical protein
MNLKNIASEKAERQRQSVIDASAAMAEYQAAIVAEREKTARLKALRLAKEAAERSTRSPVPRAPQRRRKQA